MIMVDDYQLAHEFCERTLAFLENHHLPPTPTNYSVIYLYVSNQNKNLKKAIEKQLTKKKTIDQVFIEAMFNEYLSTTNHLEQILITPFEQTLTKTLDKIDSQVSNEKEIATNLKKVDSALEKYNQYKPLQKLITFIMNLINNSQSQRKSLTDELTQTYAEVKLLRSQLDQAQQEAVLDVLTGLLNRRGCEKKLQGFSLDNVHTSIAIDIDHFKNINDEFGHAVGDKVIQLVASIIKKSIGADDIAARFGGEEFIVVMKNKSTHIAENIAEKIRRAVEGLKLIQKQTNTQLPSISISLGIAELEQDESWEDLFEKADNAMYLAKKSGRNKCVVAEPALA